MFEQARSYDPGALERIAEAVGLCRPGRSQGDLLDEIKASALDYLDALEGTGANGRVDARVEARDQLRALADAVAEASRRLDALDVRADLYLAWAAQESGVELRHGYLEALSKIADTAAGKPPVKRGPKKNEPLADFIHALAAILTDFTGQKPAAPAFNNYCPEAPYGGQFFKVVVACLEPLPTDAGAMSNQALGKRIQRTLNAMDKLTG